VLVLVAANLVLPSCADGAEGALPRATDTRSSAPDRLPEVSPPAAPATTSTTEAAGDQVAAVRRAFHDQWDAFVEITSDPDITDPLIDRHFTGEAREAVLDTVSADLLHGHATGVPDDPDLFQPSIESVEITGPASAVVVECTVDGLMVVERDSAEVVDATVVTVRIENRFERADGTWKVARSNLLSRREGVHRCGPSR
jgi:hypothetical protein